MVRKEVSKVQQESRIDVRKGGSLSQAFEHMKFEKRRSSLAGQVACDLEIPRAEAWGEAQTLTRMLRYILRRKMDQPMFGSSRCQRLHMLATGSRAGL
jgi:hypothetical protein